MSRIERFRKHVLHYEIEETAQKVWKKYSPKKAAAQRAEAKAAARGTMKLLDKHGDPVTPAPDVPGPPMDPLMETYKRPPIDGPPPVPDEAQAAPEAAPEPAPEPVAQPDLEPVPEPVAEVTAGGNGAAAKEAEEWPDPTEEMDLAYLRDMANAYEVKTTARMTAKTLVKKINEAMYE